MFTLSLASWTTEAQALPLDPADFASLGTLAPAGPITIDTDVPEITGAATFTGVLDGHVAVFAFDSVQLDVNVTVVGQNALAVLSHGSLGLGAAGLVDAAARTFHGGPGGFDGGALRPAEYPCTGRCPSVLGKGPGGGHLQLGLGSSCGGGGPAVADRRGQPARTVLRLVAVARSRSRAC